MKIFALILLSFSTAAFAANPKPVTVQGKVTVDGRVSADVTDPAQTYFTASGDLDIPAGMAVAVNVPLATVPEGQRAVIEQVSVVCSSPAGNAIIDTRVGVTRLTSPTTFAKTSFTIPIRLQGTHPANGPTFVGGLSTRLYSDRGLIDGGITMAAIRENGTGAGNCFFTLSGYNVVIDESASTPASASSVHSSDNHEVVVIPYTSEAILSELMDTYDATLMMAAPSR